MNFRACIPGLKCDMEGFFLVVLCKQEGFTKKNRSVGSVLEFQQNEPQNQQKNCDADE